jgi:hypothetical protein
VQPEQAGARPVRVTKAQPFDGRPTRRERAT